MVRTRTTSSAQPRVRHVPQRTCVACRRTGDQRTFVRLVRSADGLVEVDEAGKAPGRGAYLCRALPCWERGAKGALNAALRTNMNATNREALRAYGQRFETPTATEDTDAAATPPDPPAAAESGVA